MKGYLYLANSAEDAIMYLTSAACCFSMCVLKAATSEAPGARTRINRRAYSSTGGIVMPSTGRSSEAIIWCLPHMSVLRRKLLREVAFQACVTADPRREDPQI